MLTSACVLVLCLTGEDAPLPWRTWGGPEGNFRLPASPALTDHFSEYGPKVLWSRALGDGYSALLWEAGRLYAQFRDAAGEVLAALDASDGKTLWEFRYPVRCYPDMAQGYGQGPNATPLLEAGRLFAISIDGQLHCVEAGSGELLWRVDLHQRYGRQKRKEEYGFSASPMAFEGTILVFVGGDEHGVVALEPGDGAQLWGSPPSGVSYAPPVRIKIGDDEQVVFFSPSEVIGLDPWVGDFLWRSPVECFTGNNLTPALQLGDGHLWVASQLDGGTRVLQLPAPDARSEPQVLWSDKKITQAHWDSFCIGDHVYGSLGGNTGSFLGCVDWRTGEVLWKYRGFHLAKGILADDKFIFLDENGQLAIARLRPAGIEILAAHQLAERVAWTPPTLAGAILYARDRKSACAVDLAAASYAEAE